MKRFITSIFEQPDFVKIIFSDAAYIEGFVNSQNYSLFNITWFFCATPVLLETDVDDFVGMERSSNVVFRMSLISTIDFVRTDLYKLHCYNAAFSYSFI